MIKSKNYKVYVISNTHWDREWTKTFQESRLDLERMFNELFRLFKHDRSFKHFHLDAQTILLEDFLELHPDNAPQLKTLISEGKLLVGPWYTLPEMNVVDGECIVRNLLMGHKVADSFGRTMKVGYTPTSTGQISQLPQIYLGFGIDNIIFYRGINQELTPTEYFWEGSDGSRLLAIRPPQHFSRCNFWGHIYLPAIHQYHDHVEISKVTYISEGGGLARLATSNSKEYKELTPKKCFNIEEIGSGKKRMLDDLLPFATCPILLAMDGHDQTFPHPETTKIIEELNRHEDGFTWLHGSLEDFIIEIRQCLKRRKDHLTIKGEMRHTNRSQPRNAAHLYPAVISTKYQVKNKNRIIENLLIKKIEPAAILSFALGNTYPVKNISLLWKWLLANHSHDAINGCTIDQVTDDVLHRYNDCETMGTGTLGRSLMEIVSSIDTKQFSPEANLIGFFNFLPFKTKTISSITIDINETEPTGNIYLKDANGQDQVLQISKSYKTTCSVNKTGFTRQMPVTRFHAYADPGVMSGMGYKTFEIVSGKKGQRNAKALLANKNTLENKFLKAVFEDNGTISLTDKKNGQTYRQLHYFTDEGETGNAWVSEKPQNNKVFDSRNGQTTVSCLENGPLFASMQIQTAMKLPSCCENDYIQRSDTYQEFIIDTVVSLHKHSQYLSFTTNLQNTVKDHKLQMHFALGSEVRKYFARMPFDVIERQCPKAYEPEWTEKPDLHDPNQGFIGLYTGNRGIAVFNHALYESGISNTSNGTISITLLRCFQQYGNWSKVRWKDLQFQNPGHYTFHYAVYPFSGDWESGGVYENYIHFSNNLEAMQFTAMPGHQPPELSMIEIIGKGVYASTIKLAENRNSILVRLYNPGNKTRNVKLASLRPVASAFLVNMQEEKPETAAVNNNIIRMRIKHHQIISIIIHFLQ